MSRGTFVPAEYVERYGLAAVMLAQLDWLYNEAKHVAWVERDGYRWLVYPDHEWEATIGLNDRQARRARAKLEEAGVVACVTHRVKGVPTTYLRRVEPAPIPAVDVEPAPIPASACADSGESPAPIPANLPLYETEETTADTTMAPVGADDEQRFNVTWALYPRKQTRKAALKAWRTRVKSGVDPGVLHRATEHYAAARAGADPKYTMLGSTFFGPNDPWEDYVDGVPDGESGGPRVRERKESALERNARLLRESRAARQTEQTTPRMKELTP